MTTDIGNYPTASGRAPERDLEPLADLKMPVKGALPGPLKTVGVRPDGGRLESQAVRAE
ncbi:hypothetical protein [Microbispora sp. NPDC049633]|uniref:hypothetical protein n=1 Tax=Microbispora sp. NPDC049633 TaxID=3154355 RepID=UPI00344832FA